MSVRQNIRDVASDSVIIRKDASQIAFSAKNRVSLDKKSGATPNRNELVISAHTDADYHPPWSRWPKNPCYLHGLPHLPPCYCTAQRPLPESTSSKLNLSYCVPSHRAYSALLISHNQPPVLPSTSAYTIRWVSFECKRVTVGSRFTTLRTVGEWVVWPGLVRLLGAGGTSKWLQQRLKHLCMSQ